jgi:hypothetical protein
MFFTVQQVFVKDCGNSLKLCCLTAARGKLSGQCLFKRHKRTRDNDKSK